MATYINSAGAPVDVSTLEDVHLARALARAIRENNTDNVAVLQAETDARAQVTAQA